MTKAERWVKRFLGEPEPAFMTVKLVTKWLIRAYNAGRKAGRKELIDTAKAVQVK